MNKEYKKKLAAYYAHLEEGVKARLDALIVSRDKNQCVEIARQLKNWRAELNELDKRLKAHCKLVEQPLLSDAESKRVDIVVLKYMEPEIETRCLRMLVKWTQWPYKITFYDNRNQSANFSRIWNELTYRSTCDYVLIMDSDAFVTNCGEECWLTRMMSSFKKDFSVPPLPGSLLKSKEKVGLVVPVTHHTGAHTIQGKHRRDTSKTIYRVGEQVSGFFFLFKKEMWEEIGGFDERFYLHGQDSEWIDRVLESDWDTIMRGDVFVDHMVSASINRSRESGRIDYEADIAHTKLVYDLIREEKKAGTYEPPRF